MSTQGQWRGNVDGVWFGGTEVNPVIPVFISANLSGSGDLTASVNALAALAADLLGTGDLVGTLFEEQLTDTHDGWWAKQHAKKRKKTEQEKAQAQLELVIEQAVQAVAQQKPVAETGDDDLEMLMMML